MQYWIHGFLNSYAQLFFSVNKLLALFILLVTFMSPELGVSAALAVILINTMAHFTGLSRVVIEEGMYGFNAVLLGLALSYEYSWSISFLYVFVSAIGLLLFTTVFFETNLGKHKLPFLGLPFLVTYWILYLSMGNFSLINLSERDLYIENYIAHASNSWMYNFTHSLDQLEIPELLKSYLKTLSSTFFQNSVLAGILIAGGILWFSRIAFTLSLIGFFSAFFWFDLLGVDTRLLTEFLVGSNFIFMAIAIGGFYLVPNFWSYLSVILLVPILSFFLISLGKLMDIAQLKAFTLSFSVLTILFLFFLRQRWWPKHLHLITIQYYNPEKTVYKHQNTISRFQYAHLAKITLPFWGEWRVSQGYDGEITHLGEWSKALDFVITDEAEKTFQKPGTQLTNFYCYNKPVVAPLNGFVYAIESAIDDNPIGAVNTKKNWGNTLILNHQNGLFSQISHLRKNSLKVAVGDYVERGSVLASCGNSGRSPEPHIHFQLQLSPKIGAKPIAYPLAYFIEKTPDSSVLRNFAVPKEGAIISNVEVSTLLKTQLELPPEHILRVEGEHKTLEWVTKTDSMNRKLMHCKKSRSTVWFENDGISFYCYDFQGDRKSLLYKFYLSFFRLLLSTTEGVTAEDRLPSNSLGNKIFLFAQDFVAPFYRVMRPEYQSHCEGVDNVNQPKEIRLVSRVLMSREARELIRFDMVFKLDQPMEWSIHTTNSNQRYTCEFV